jgi:hypothetical protein
VTGRSDDRMAGIARRVVRAVRVAGPHHRLRRRRAVEPLRAVEGQHMPGSGRHPVFVPSFECLSTAAGQRSWMYGIWPDGNLHPGGPYMPGWPVGPTSLAGRYDQSIDFVEEGAARGCSAHVPAGARVRHSRGIAVRLAGWNNRRSASASRGPGCVERYGRRVRSPPRAVACPDRGSGPVVKRRAGRPARTPRRGRAAVPRL